VFYGFIWRFLRMFWGGYIVVRGVYFCRWALMLGLVIRL